MPKLIGKAVRVVETDSISIDEVAGNVSTNSDTISIACVTVSKPTSEPWLTLDYHEWICVRKGYLELHSEGNDVLTLNEGETAFISKGERFRPIFPVPCEYIPVCSPAFRPDRCVREEDGVSDVSAKLAVLHKKEKPILTTGIPNEDHSSVDILYHMCEKSLWTDSVSSSKAYFPPTYEADGMFTHATAVPSRLVETGNHFYTSSKGDWICLEVSRFALEKLGIRTVFEEPKAVGETGVSLGWDWICPHVYGGIPTTIDGVVKKVFDINRDEQGNFVSIVGLTDV